LLVLRDPKSAYSIFFQLGHNNIHSPPPSQTDELLVSNNNTNNNMGTLSSSSSNNAIEIYFTPNEEVCRNEEEMVYRFLQGMNTQKKEQIAAQFFNGDGSRTSTAKHEKKTESSDEEVVYKFLQGMNLQQKERLSSRLLLLPILQEVDQDEEETQQ
jgi:hypothetical protein